MKRTLLAVLCTALVVAMVAPAFAAYEFAFNGYFRSRMIRTNTFTAAKSEENPDTVIDQRFRGKFTVGLNEYVSAVYYGEVDMQWGDTSYGTGRNNGGALGGDNANIETKNVYVDLKIPETPMGARVGLQGYGDNWDGVFFATDMAGVKLFGAWDVVSGNLMYTKWDENSTTSDRFEDDTDLWAVQLAFTVSEELQLGLDGYYMNANCKGGGNRPCASEISGASAVGLGSDNADLFWVGIDGTWKLDMFTLDGWAVWSGGQYDNAAANGKDLEVSGFGANLKGTFSVAGATISLRGFWFSGDDDPTDTDADYFQIPASGETFWLYDEHLMIMSADTYGNTVFQVGYSITDALVPGFGLVGFVLSGSYVPPEMKQAYVKASVGYFTTTDGQDAIDKATDGDVSVDDDLGWEFGGRLGYKLADLFDVSLNGSVAVLGDFYDDNPLFASADEDGKVDPDTQYMGYVMVNVGW